ncbi:hypothetical protein ACSBR2_031645 [Camellia fascicularis]
MEIDVSGFEANNNLHGEIEEIEDEIDKRFKCFKNFDITSDPPSDHHFSHHKMSTNNNKHVFFGSNNSLAENLQKEWKVLETNLPDFILVRAYQNRIDLMRAAVIGPPNTPYNHGVFFFDIVFPSNYPAMPPKLFYHSNGLDLNPNLHPDGKVSLRLLQKWNPKQSNLLQLLVSIPCLVLNSKPYLNQFHRLYLFYELEVLKYNKNAFMLTCEAMMRTLQMPPRHFEDFVAGHFRQRAHPILLKYKEHMDEDESECMRQLFLKLLKAFEENGAYCKHHLISQVKIEKKSDTEDRSTNNGIVTRVFKRLTNPCRLDNTNLSTFSRLF